MCPSHHLKQDDSVTLAGTHGIRADSLTGDLGQARSAIPTV